MKSLLYQNNQGHIPEIVPVIPTMDVVVFPNMIVPLLVLDEKIIKGINQALQESKLVLLLAAKSQVDGRGAIGTNDLYQIGTIATVMRLIKIPEGGVKILTQGVCRARASEIITQDGMLHARTQKIDIEKPMSEDELQEQIKDLKAITEKMVNLGYTFSPDFHLILSKVHDPEKVADFILSHLNLTVKQAQSLLEITNQQEFFQMLYHYLKQEIEVAEIQEKVTNNARESINKSQKEIYLREQLRAIQQELGDDLEEIEIMRQKLQEIKLPKDSQAEILRQINRLERTAPDSLEATVTRNYLEWIFSLPWNCQTEDNLEIDHAKQILEEDHFGLKDIKERILDFISIRNLRKDAYSPILCFVGPPGTGKTSLGQSIAKSLGRKYARISLGGVKDEAEIRGHRRTYVGSMPGRFIQAIRKAGTSNPVIIIDELDKIGTDFRGDPSAAMLEVLDPQQNKTFHDNYLGIPFDLSKVMFIATANTIDTISDPLLDRMEMIELSGYMVEEKISIGKQHLISKAIIDTGLENHNIKLDDAVLKEIITTYTREAGVRQFERIIRKLFSKTARMLVESNKLITFTPNNLETYLGPRQFLQDDIDHQDRIGISNGLAYTTYGGEILKIEAVLMPGKGQLILTGQLGDVMKESAQAAVSYARSHAQDFDIDDKIFKTHDLHIHVPSGGVPKDGPSAGITMLASILSALTKRPINANFAMTGELNLRGEIMPIGGLKEKILAAKRNKVAHVIAPKKNKKDLVGIDEELIKGIDIIWVNHADEVLEKVLQPKKIQKKDKIGVN